MYVNRGGRFKTADSCQGGWHAYALYPVVAKREVIRAYTARFGGYVPQRLEVCRLKEIECVRPSLHYYDTL